jgi:hypothetical protein
MAVAMLVSWDSDFRHKEYLDVWVIAN